jgi:hypothetical protein
MNDQPNSENQVSSPKFLSLPWSITLVVAWCILVPVAGAVSEEVGGWLHWVIWSVAWGAMFIVAWIVTYKYANPKLPLICGAMMGITAPRPSDVWLRQIAGESWGFVQVPKAIDIAITMIGVVIGMTIFNAIAKRHKSSAG